MQTQKMSLANITGKLSRAEMKNIMAGSGAAKCDSTCTGSCTVSSGASGKCQKGVSDPSKCFCISIS